MDVLRASARLNIVNVIELEKHADRNVVVWVVRTENQEKVLL